MNRVEDERAKAVLEAVRDEGDWGADLPEGVAQGVVVAQRVQGLGGHPRRGRHPGRRPPSGDRPAPPPGRGSARSPCAVDVGLRHQPRSASRRRWMGGIMDRHRPRAQRQPAPAPTATSSRAAGTTAVLHPAVERPAGRSTSSSMPPTADQPGGAGELGVAATMAAVACAYARATGTMPTELPDQPRPAAARLRRRCPPSRPIPGVARPTASDHTDLRSPPCPPTPSPSTASRVTVDMRRRHARCSGCCATSWACTGPKYGCGIEVCKACTSHINGPAFNPCSVPRRRHPADRRDHHDRRSAGHGRRRTCTRCRRRGSTRTCRSAATASPARSWPPSPWSRRPGRGQRDHRRRPRRDPQRVQACGTYSRIRGEAVKQGAENM